MRTEESAKRVGIWIRVSTEDQVRGESPEHHERRARHYAEAKGWDVVEVYRLDAISGKTVKETLKRSACSKTSRRAISPASSSRSLPVLPGTLVNSSNSRKSSACTLQFPLVSRL